MHTVGAFEAKTHFSALLQQVENGEEITITKHGRAVARLVPAVHKNQLTVEETIQHLNAFRKRHTLGDLDWKTLRDEGRK